MGSVPPTRLAAAQVPGVYYSPRTREPESPFTRTDVAGFVGFVPSNRSSEANSNLRQPIRCDDWQDYVLSVSHAPEPLDDGSLLSHAVRSFFINGGRRCYVVLVEPPNPNLLGDAQARDIAAVLERLLGAPGQSETDATGLERLLLIDEVAIVDVPDLYAFRPAPPLPPEILGGSEVESGFQPCTNIRGPIGPVLAERQLSERVPLFDHEAVFDIQKRMMARCIPERWRVLLLLNVPWHGDSATSPSPVEADRWRMRFHRLVRLEGFAEAEEMSCATLYYPWVQSHDRLGSPIRIMPPSALVAGIIARRDLERGPHIAPANEELRGVVQLAWPINDDLQATLCPDAANSFDQLPGINVLRAFPGRGIQVWGARTLSTDNYLRYISVRRCLSCIQRRLKFALDALVFEPNSAILWMQITQIAFSTLEELFESGALRGERIEQAFFVRCDSGINQADDIQSGKIYCEVGVAIVAPAEFIVFRLGRREGVAEVID